MFSTLVFAKALIACACSVTGTPLTAASIKSSFLFITLTIKSVALSTTSSPGVNLGFVKTEKDARMYLSKLLSKNALKPLPSGSSLTKAFFI